MQTLWFVTNPGSGSATPDKCTALEAIFTERGLTLAGRTHFPDDDLPTAEGLDAAGVDTLVLFAGDGTINAALSALTDWQGAFLILPGGTMNLLAKTLHGPADPAAIIHAAHADDRRTALPFLEAGGHRAFVGLIIGPAANWFRAREAVRNGQVRSLWRAVRLAWGRTFRDHVRIAGVAAMRERYQAILAKPDRRGVDVNAVEARDWRSISELGWDWLTGDWVAAKAVSQCVASSFRIAGHRDVLALFDGEPMRLPVGTEVTGGMTRESFITTRDPAA